MITIALRIKFPHTHLGNTNINIQTLGNLNSIPIGKEGPSQPKIQFLLYRNARQMASQHHHRDGMCPSAGVCLCFALWYSKPLNSHGFQYMFGKWMKMFSFLCISCLHFCWLCFKCLSLFLWVCEYFYSPRNSILVFMLSRQIFLPAYLFVYILVIISFLSLQLGAVFYIILWYEISVFM